MIYDAGQFSLVNPQSTFGTNAVKDTFVWQDIYLSCNFDHAGGGAVTPMDINVALPSSFTVFYPFPDLGVEIRSLCWSNIFPPSVGRIVRSAVQDNDLRYFQMGAFLNTALGNVNPPWREEMRLTVNFPLARD
ncbi:MAG: hypothetical protein WCS94_24735 [Verrucomicrobiota bacterium]